MLPLSHLRRLTGASRTAVDKIDIQGADYTSTLLQYIEPSELPAALGGTCVCPGGCTRSDAGPWQHALKAKAAGVMPADAQPSQPSSSPRSDPSALPGAGEVHEGGLQPSGGPKGDPAPPAEAPVAIEVTVTQP